MERQYLLPIKIRKVDKLRIFYLIYLKIGYSSFRKMRMWLLYRKIKLHKQTAFEKYKIEGSHRIYLIVSSTSYIKKTIRHGLTSSNSLLILFTSFSKHFLAHLQSIVL